jgi:hypothetical protein
VTTGEGSGIPENVACSGFNFFENAEGTGDTCTSPPSFVPSNIPEPVDWANLIIHQDEKDDGDATTAVDEDKVYEAIGFWAADQSADDAAREAIPIPAMTAAMQQKMNEAAVPVDDNVPEEPLFHWDKDNPDLSVGISYPSMQDLRLAVKRHAIVRKIELGTAHSDKKRYRVHCAALGCPWVRRARTQHDGSSGVQFLVSVIFHLCSLFLSFFTYAFFFYHFYLCILQPFFTYAGFFCHFAGADK